MIGTNSAIIAPNIDTQLSKITAIRNRSTFVAHPLYTTVQFRANGSHAKQNSRPPTGIVPRMGVGCQSFTLPSLAGYVCYEGGNGITLGLTF
jgi:hypothetical protein